MNESHSIVTLARAYHFAAAKHVDQRRKGEAAEPYMNHLTEVAELVAEATAGKDPGLVIAAVLHDTLEDTSATAEELSHLFGPTVASLVTEVTDDKALPKAARKELQIQHASTASRNAQIIKIADKIANLRSLAASPPADWDLTRIDDYGRWALRVVDQCRAADAGLAAQFDEALSALNKSSQT